MQVVFMGSMGAPSRHGIDQFPHPGMVQAIGKLPRGMARDLAEQADAVLLIQNQEEEWGGTIPAKTYEYLAAGRPIVGLLYRNPELAALLQEGPAGADTPPPSSRRWRIYRRWESAVTAKPYA
jgi:hypothetical protein